jgi:glycosyltransferase involved in cell wall biosynthesis
MTARICMLVRNDCRTDQRVLKEASSMARAGYAVTVVALNIYGPSSEEEREGFRIVRVPVAQARTKAGRGVNLLPRAIWRMAQAAAAVRADVYHAHDSDAVLPAWLAARRAPGARLLYDAHEVGFITLRDSVGFFGPFVGSLNWLWGVLTDWIVRHRVDAVISVNDVLADLQAAHYGIPRPAVVMNCPPRPKISAARSTRLAERIGVSPETPIVICQGMLVRDRHGVGLENLIRAAPLLARGVVAVIGRGPQFDELAALAGQPPFAGRAFVLPAVPPEDLLSYTAGAAIGAIPTEIHQPILRYSSPNKLFEYLAVGLPIVTSDLPIVRRICEAYGCGVVCDPTSPAAIAGAINPLLADPDRWAKMRAGALAAAAVYNWEAQERNLLGVYERLLRG